MKKIVIMCLCLCYFLPFAIAQSSSPNNIQNIPQTKYLGFLNNRGVSVRTANIPRMWVNPNGTLYNSIPTSGYIGIGEDPTDVRSRLTITGGNNTPFSGGGYRAWMKTGTFCLENSDNAYFGLKEEGVNRSDAVLAFGDDPAGFPTPRNNFRIMFVQTGNPNDNHLELARYTANGNIGFGSVFGDNANIVPHNLLHLNHNGTRPTHLQISNQNGTGQQATDGLKLGVEGLAGGQAGLLQWQENTPFVIRTDWNNTGGGTAQGERVRISSISSTGVPLPASPLDGNITRVAISHRGSQPITEPRSLLHLGYNTGGIIPGTADGWRDWMDVGTFTSQATDNMYVGLKREGGFFDDRHDAVINWGDNQDALGPFDVGPDNLRFIFTSTLGFGAGDPVSQSNDGLEVGRFDPTQDNNGLADSYGKFGVGDFYTTGIPVTHKLHVRGNGRFEYVPDHVDAEYLILGKEQDAGNNPDDIALRKLAFPNDNTQVLLGDGTWGTVSSITDNQQIQFFGVDCTTNELTLDLENGGPPQTVDLSCIAGTDDQQLQAVDYDCTTGQLSVTLENGGTQVADLSCIDGTDDQQIQFFDIDCNTNELTLTLEDGGTQTADLSCISGTDDQEIQFFDYDCDNEILTLTLEDGGTQVADLSCIDGTDDQQIQFFDINCNTNELTLTLEDGGTQTADLSCIGGTDDQEIQFFDYDCDNELLTLTLEDGGTQVADLSCIDGTDDQQLQLFDFDCATGQLTIALEDGGTQVADLSCLGGGGAGLLDAHNGTSESNINPGWVAFGQDLNELGDPGRLLNNREVPMNNNNIYFTDDGATNTGQNRIGMGTTSAQGRLHVKVNDQISENLPKGIVVDNDQVASNGVTQGLNINMSGDNILNTGAWLVINGAGTNTGLDTRIDGGVTSNGLFGRATDATNGNNGVVGEAVSFNVFTNVNTAVRGVARYGRTNYGGFFEGSGNTNGASSSNYGVYARALGTGVNNYGIYATAQGGTVENWAAYFNGSGFLSASMWMYSDQRLKKDVNDIENATNIIEHLSPKTYEFKHEEYPSIVLSEGKQFGLIAQEVEKVLPNLVKPVVHPAEYDENGNEVSAPIELKGINYDGFIPILIQGHKEQQNYIKELEAKVEAMDDRLAKLEELLTTGAELKMDDQAQSVTLEDVKSIVLNQNVPNPFAERTTISYTIPAEVSKAQIHFYNELGALINTVEIAERGDGQINVYAQDLSDGIYTYSLVADGKVITSKRMIKN